MNAFALIFPAKTAGRVLTITIINRYFLQDMPRASEDQKRRIAQVNVARSRNRPLNNIQGERCRDCTVDLATEQSAARAESLGLSPEGGVLLAGIFLSRRIAVPPYLLITFSRTFRSSL